MKKIIHFALTTVFTLICALPCIAQEQASTTENAVAPISGQGTIGKIPKFTRVNTIGDSVLTERGQRIGINTSLPTHTLTIQKSFPWTSNRWGGAISLPNGSAIGWQPQTVSPNFSFGIGQTNRGFYIFHTLSSPGTLDSPAIYDLAITSGGLVGVGTSTPDRAKLHVKGGNDFALFAESNNSVAVTGESPTDTGVFGFGFVGVMGKGGTGVYAETSSPNGLAIHAVSPNYAARFEGKVIITREIEAHHDATIVGNLGVNGRVSVEGEVCASNIPCSTNASRTVQSQQAQIEGLRKLVEQLQARVAQLERAAKKTR